VNKVIFNDGSTFQPTKIVAVGLNYADHINEMNSKKPSEPVLFFKPTTAMCHFSDPIILPKNMGSVHYELELAICIKKESKAISQIDAEKYIAGFGMALDLTLRDVQSKAKEKGRPWAVAKGFDNSCPITTFFKKPLAEIENTEISLSINGQVKQNASTSLMLFKIEELISYISNIFTLLPGDIILTGTPAGVGPLNSGDKIQAHIECLVSAHTEAK